MARSYRKFAQRQRLLGGNVPRRFLDLESLESRHFLAGDVIAADSTMLVGGSVAGTKWDDLNQNGRRDDHEPGLPGVTIYADLNRNQRLDPGEPATITQKDDPDTRLDERGRYVLPRLPSGTYAIREVVPPGYQQTYPQRERKADPSADALVTVQPRVIEVSAEPGDVVEQVVSIAVHPLCIRPYEFDVVPFVKDEPGVPGVEVVNHSGIQVNGCGGDVSEFKVEIMVAEAGQYAFDLAFLDRFAGDVVDRIPVTINGSHAGGHVVTIEPGLAIEGLDFGNARTGPPQGTIEGRVWLDADGDGQRDADERGLGGVQLYLDLNNNAQPDFHEPRTITAYENRVTEAEEAGRYSFRGLLAGEYIVRQLVPSGYEQTQPQLDAVVVDSQTGRFGPGSALDFAVTAVSFTPSAASIEITVQWPNGCGTLLPEQTTHTVIGDTILVEVHGAEVGEVCTEAIQARSITLNVPGLHPGDVRVVGTLHEEREPGEQATLGLVSQLRLGPQAGQRVRVSENEIVANVDFGTARTGPGETLRGTTWNDINGDGIRQRHEPGLGGVVIYLDLDENGELTAGEPTATTLAESVTNVDSVGSFVFDDLEPGRYTVREVVPTGFQQTFPRSLAVRWPAGPEGDPFVDAHGVLADAHHVVLPPGGSLTGLDFGNQSSEPGIIQGVTWLDVNGDGHRSDDEPGLPGVVIYLDRNGNAVHEADEPYVTTSASGSYQLPALPGRYVVREVVPAGFEQTYPRGIPFAIPGFDPSDPRRGRPIFIDPSGHFVTVLPGQVVEGLDFGNRKLMPGAIHGVTWKDANGNGSRERDEVGLAGVTIYLDTNLNGSWDEAEPRVTTASDDPATTDVDETGSYSFDDLPPNVAYHVREVVPGGFRQTFPTDRLWPLPLPLREAHPPFDPPVDPWEPAASEGVHYVFVASGQTVEGIDFGNQPIREPGVVRGIVWDDANGNGRQDETEKGLGGVCVYADLNRNGRLDFGEPFDVSRSNDPHTVENESGSYALTVAPGTQLILQVVPAGSTQTFPSTLREVIFPYNLGHGVVVSPAETRDEVNFGNYHDPQGGASISGVVWIDDNGNGLVDPGESPQSGVTVYLDRNNNGLLDPDEPSTVSAAASDDPADLIRPGSYTFDVSPGEYTVREVVPAYFAQISPSRILTSAASVAVRLPGGVATNFALEEAAMLNSALADGGQQHVQLTFEAAFPPGQWHMKAIDARVREQTIEVLLEAAPWEHDADTPSVQRTTVDLGELKLGDYTLQATLIERHPEREPSGDVKSSYVEGTLTYRGYDAHRIHVVSGQRVEGLNFGILATPNQSDGADSRLGEDPHGSQTNDEATRVAFHDGHLRLNSFVDHDGDLDVFRFVGNDADIVAKGGRVDGGSAIRFELLDAKGIVVQPTEDGAPMQARTIAGETYFLRVSGVEGQYAFDLFEKVVGTDDQTVTAETRADINADRRIDFADFLILSENFGKRVDEAFAHGDLDGDGIVAFSDFLILAHHFGTE